MVAINLRSLQQCISEWDHQLVVCSLPDVLTNGCIKQGVSMAATNVQAPTNVRTNGCYQFATYLLPYLSKWVPSGCILPQQCILATGLQSIQYFGLTKEGLPIRRKWVLSICCLSASKRELSRCSVSATCISKWVIPCGRSNSILC